jgi:hypothetical protein
MISWDERYGAEDYYYGTDANDFLQAHHARIPSGGEVLCLAEGEGRNAVFLATQGFHVVALDQSTVGLAKARRLAQARNVQIETVLENLDRYRIESGRWDGIVSIWCHVPAPLRRRLHRAVVEGLKPGGTLVLEAYVPEQLRYGTGGPPDASLLPRLEELRDELQGLELVHGLELERVVREGRGHDGLSAVVQVLAHKPGTGS